MSVTIDYTCDKCGKIQHTDQQFWSVGVVVQHGGGTISGYGKTVAEDKQLEVCRDCLELLGIHRRQDIEPGKIALPAPPTLEDLILEIVRNEVTNMTGAT